MIESLCKTAIQIPMLFHSKIPVGSCLIPACDDVTQEAGSAFMLVQHLCHHWLHRAEYFYGGEKTAEGPHGLRE